METIEGPHPATVEEEILLRDCDIQFGRSTGPGGQNRNRRDTATTVTHRPTGIIGAATERRSQGQNRSRAMFRLRLKLASGVRSRTHHEHHKPSELWTVRRQGRSISVNPMHADYPALLAEALDVIVARRYDVAGAAGVLDISMSQLAKLVRHDKRAFAMINRGREAQGLPRLK
ncbi:MAG: peptide chain release factor-like protein [Planctomycetota bacterium]|nr:peptide chain release factor-like protein [Planctomycetota bacterium]